MSHSPGGFIDDDSWFHGQFSRDQAEQLLLQQAGDEDGTFLVRESSTSVGDYAISVLSAGEVHHVQIKRHEGDAFFSIEDGPILHGLVELIKYYQSPESQEKEDSILLTIPLIKSPPPPDCRRHGRTNLLHRATKEASTEIVMEMVRCGHRSLDAKNEDGQTALHLAAMQGLNPILKILLAAGANVNARDSQSLTPLHYACINDLPEAVIILLDEGNANPQIRRSDNGWVPMHEAAHRGHLNCIKILWRHYAPLRPRTFDQKLPIHLAIEGVQEETISFFDSAKSRRPMSNRDDWYHGPLERDEADRMCQLCQNTNVNDDPSISYFLIRRHSKKNNVFVLTMLYQNKSYRFEIGREHNFFFIDDGPYLDSLETLVDHYSRWPDGLPSTLQVPVSPLKTFSQPPTLSRKSMSGTPGALEIPPPLPKRIPLGSSPNTFSRLCNDVTNNNRPLPPFSRDKVAAELIELGESLGGGEYGEVFKGKLTMTPTNVIDVAVKTLKSEDLKNDWSKQEFLQEAKVMMDLEHEHIVRIIGICWEPRILMVQELMTLGCIQTYLSRQPLEINPDKDFRLWAHQIAKGMVYLQRKHLIHRDLAARNILLNSSRDAKISDFGLSRALNANSDYYTASHGGRWPIKWYAPESCNHGTFSHASDVWSYGITLWEIYSFGAVPYGEDIKGADVIDMVARGERLDKPKHCTDQIYSVMKKCWNMNADLRPTFMFLENFFASATTSNEATTPIIETLPSITFQAEELQISDNDPDAQTLPVDLLNLSIEDNSGMADNNLNFTPETGSNSNDSLHLIDFS